MYDSRFFCPLHFDSSSFKTDDHNSLKPGAVPFNFENDPLSAEEMKFFGLNVIGKVQFYMCGHPNIYC